MRIIPALSMFAVALVAGGVLSAGASGTGPCTTVIRGTSASETLAASVAGTRVLGLEGNDRITGGAGADCIDGGPGNDRIAGLAGADVMTGGPGTDVISGGPGADRISDVASAYAPGFASSNRVTAGSGADVADVANGRRDKVHCGSGRDRVVADREDKLEGCERKRFRRSPLPEAGPRKGGRRQIFMVRFRAIEEVASQEEHFSIVVSSPGGRCGRIETSSVGVRYRAGETVRYRLQPFGPGGKGAKRWCRGLYRGRVDFVRGSEPPLRLGRFSFRVR